MNIIADLHLHSRFAQACSKHTTIPLLEKSARIKGLNLLGTGDFTHPIWIKELKEQLSPVPEREGIFQTATGFPFMLTTELSFIYTHNKRGRKVHLCVFAPSFEIVDQITHELLKVGRVDYDGRPIFGMSCHDFVERMKAISSDIEIIPAHIWTPYFGVFGSKSGFDSLKDCFGDQIKHIRAVETGLSSDPGMNWRVKELDNYQLVSFSDAHSSQPWRIGREATVFEGKTGSYNEIINAVRTGEGLKSTLEFWPEEGIYHYDGHSACNVCMSPKESRKIGKICPACKKEMTIGVAHRVEELAEREEGFRGKNAKPYSHLIPLTEIISKAYGKGITTKKVADIYQESLKAGANELDILMSVSAEKLAKHCHRALVELIIKNRNEKIAFKPGFDGVYGEPIIEPVCGDKQIKL